MKNLALLFCFLGGLFLQPLSSQVLVSSTFKLHRSKAQLQTEFNNPLIINGIDAYKITYLTPDVQGNSSVASGLLVVPDNRAKVYPMLCYMHGTSISDNEVPSALNGESDLPVIYGGMGYITIAPDYLGLGDSPGFHPYVHAATEASVGVDMFRAAREYAVSESIYFNDQVFLTGYSQGGHSAMALHRSLEQDYPDEFKVTAAAPMSGPYSIGEVMRELVLSEEAYLYPAYIPNTMLSYQMMYGNMWTDITDMFEPTYVDVIEQYFNGGTNLLQLNATLVAKLVLNEGASIPSRMLTDTLKNAVLADPNHPVNLALKDNNTYNWVPEAPTRIYYCTADDQVPFENSIVARDTMLALGAADLQAIDVNPSANHSGCVTPAVFQTLLFFGGLQMVGDSISSTSGSSKPLHLDVSPNPAGEVVFLKNLPSAGTLHFFDLNGRLCRSVEVAAGGGEVPVGEMREGIYLLELVGEKAVWVEKLLVSRRF